MELISIKVLKDVNKILKLNNGGFMGLILSVTLYRGTYIRSYLVEWSLLTQGFVMTFIQGHITQVNVMLIQAGHFFFKQKKKMIPSGLIN